MPWYDIKASQYGSILVNGYAYPFIDQAVLEGWLPSLTYLSPFNYGFKEDGTLVPLNDDRLRSAAEASGVATLMVVAPMNEEGQFSSDLASAVLNNPTARNNLINNIYNNVVNKGYYGADFDFEFVYAKDREEYVTLVSDAAAKLNPNGYIVTVTLAPKTSVDQAGLLYQGHDYAGLGKAANLALLMTYEWGYTYGPPMAVAPIPQVRQVIEFGITQIPADKLLMGIPNYGYDWTLPFVQGESKAETISNLEAVERAAQHNIAIQFDETAMAPFYHYTDEQGRVHEVWFENERSIRAKLELVNEYGLAGISIWTIMNPFPDFVRILNEMYTVAKVE